MAKRIEERTTLSAGKVDRAGAYPVVREVLLCGATSANRRRYRKEAFAGERVKRYAGVWVYMNHGKARESRRYEDRLAKVINPRHRADGMPVGDLEVRPKHPMAEQFLFDAEHDPTSCGMSHVANCETVTSQDGWEEITEVVSVESVDLVTDPATTKGLHEGKKVPTTLKQFAEQFPAKYPKATAAQRKFLLFLEDDMGLAGMDVSAPLPEEPADEGHEAAVDSAFEDAGCAIWKAFTKGEIDIDEVTRKLKELAKGHGKVQGTGKDSGGDSKSDDDKGDSDGEGDDVSKDKADKESKRPDPVDVLSECVEAGLAKPGKGILRYLCTLPDADRAEFLKEHKIATADAAAQKPKAGARSPGASAAGAKKTEEAAVPTDGKAFAESVKG